MHAKMGEVVLHAGDVLLLDAGPDLVREGFALVSILGFCASAALC